MENKNRPGTCTASAEGRSYSGRILKEGLNNLLTDCDVRVRKEAAWLLL